MTVVEFLGMSRAGKTTQISRLREYLREKNIKFLISGRPQIRFKDVNSLEDFHEMMYNHLLNHYKLYQEHKCDFLIYDRGFYDRMFLLQLDYKDKRVSEIFKEGLIRDISTGLNLIDIPIMLLIEERVSLERWQQQIREGLDNLMLSEGLDLRDKSIEGLEEYHMG